MATIIKCENKGVCLIGNVIIGRVDFQFGD